MRYRPLRPSRPSKRVVAQHLNALRAFAPDDKVIAELPVRKARTFDPAAGSEHKEQAAVIRWWDGTRHRAGAHLVYGLPIYALFSVPNSGRRSIMQAVWLKEEGLRRGIPDLQLAVPRGIYHGAVAEMKFGGGHETDEQTECLAFFKAQGYRTGVFWTAETAIAFFSDYLGGK